MDDLKALNLLVQSGSFGVLVLLVIWVIRFIPKRIEKADQLRELEAEAKREVAKTLQETIQKIVEANSKVQAEQEKSHTETVNRVIASNAEQLRYEREFCEKSSNELKEILETFRREGAEERQKQYEILRDISHGIRDVQQTRANERALRKAQEGKPPGSNK